MLSPFVYKARTFDIWNSGSKISDETVGDVSLTVADRIPPPRDFRAVRITRMRHGLNNGELSDHILGTRSWLLTVLIHIGSTAIGIFNDCQCKYESTEESF